MANTMRTVTAEPSEHETMVTHYQQARHEVSRLTCEIAAVLGEVDRLLADRTASDGDVFSLTERLHPLRAERVGWMAVTDALGPKLLHDV